LGLFLKIPDLESSGKSLWSWKFLAIRAYPTKSKKSGGKNP